MALTSLSGDGEKDPRNLDCTRRRQVPHVPWGACTAFLGSRTSACLTCGFKPDLETVTFLRTDVEALEGALTDWINTCHMICIGVGCWKWCLIFLGV